MSDLLIRGMEMPKDIEPGLVIEFADGIDGKRYARLYHYQHGGLTEWLEAVPVPPHGRLVDAWYIRDAIIQKWMDKAGDSHMYKCGMEDAYEVIRNAPTIIPASEEKE